MGQLATVVVTAWPNSWAAARGQCWLEQDKWGWYPFGHFGQLGWSPFGQFGADPIGLMEQEISQEWWSRTSHWTLVHDNQLPTSWDTAAHPTHTFTPQKSHKNWWNTTQCRPAEMNCTVPARGQEQRWGLFPNPCWYREIGCCVGALVLLWASMYGLWTWTSLSRLRGHRHTRIAKAVTIASHKENKFGLSHGDSGCQGTGVSRVKTLLQAVEARTESDFTAYQERNKEEKRKVKFLSISRGKREKKWMMCHCQD